MLIGVFLNHPMQSWPQLLCLRCGQNSPFIITLRTLQVVSLPVVRVHWYIARVLFLWKKKNQPFWFPSKNVTDCSLTRKTNDSLLHKDLFCSLTILSPTRCNIPPRSPLSQSRKHHLNQARARSAWPSLHVLPHRSLPAWILSVLPTAGTCLGLFYTTVVFQWTWNTAF